MSRFPSPRTRPSRRSTRRSASTGACGPTTSRSRARTRGCSPRRGSSATTDRDALLAGLDAVEAELRDGHASRSRPTTRTSTWRSSGGSPSSPARSAARLHTARSRNDQVGDRRRALHARGGAGAAPARSTALMAALVDAAERHLDWPLPGYTHLQRAQPVYLCHHLLAYVWMLARDRERFASPPRQTAALPLGAGALAGVNFDTDRGMVAAELGFDARRARTRSTRSPTATSSSTTSAPPRPARRTSRASAPRSCCGPARSSASSSCPTRGRRGSSIMPQKKNPDAAELLRAKAPRIVGAPRRAARRDARAPADLQQGPAGGQGAPLRRRRHARAVPRRRRPG